VNRPPRVGKDDLLDAGAAAWTALRLHEGKALQVSDPERDEKGLSVTICY
jgi:predicted RNase H-like nuclease